MKISVTGSTLINAVIQKMEDVAKGDYFIFLPGFGIIRCRKTTQISWQWFGVGVQKTELQKRLVEYGQKTGIQIDIEIIEGEYKLPLLDQYLNNSTPEESNVVDEGFTPEEKKQKAGKKELEATYKKKQVKNALASCDCFSKKEQKLIIKSIGFDGKNCNGFDILDGVDVFKKRAATKEEADTIFSNL